MYKKKNVNLLVILCMILANIFAANLFIDSAFAASTVSQSVYDSQLTEQVSIESNLIGDVNGDGNINSLDFAYMRMFLLDSKNSFPISNGRWASDTDGNGTFNSIDFAYMRKFLLGIITVFPRESLVIDNPTCFEYALFAGDTEEALRIYGENFKIHGDIRSNNSITVYAGPNAIIDGECEAVNNIVIYGVSSNYEIRERESELCMPDLNDCFRLDSQISNTYISGAYNPSTGRKYYQDLVEEDGKFMGDNFSENCTLEYSDDSNPTWIISGDKLLLHENMPIFFDGNVKLCVDQISGNGFIVATGNIIFDIAKNTDFGLKYKVDGKVDLENSSEIGLYSINGNIDFNIPSKLQGLIYAPGVVEKNEFGDELTYGGKIRIRGIEFYGSIVGRVLELSGYDSVIFTDTSLHKELRSY